MQGNRGRFSTPLKKGGDVYAVHTKDYLLNHWFYDCIYNKRKVTALLQR